MIYSKLSKRGQLVIPKKIRDMVAIEPGDTLKFYVENNRIIMEKIDLSPYVSLVSFLKQGTKFDDKFVQHLRDEWE